MEDYWKEDGPKWLEYWTKDLHKRLVGECQQCGLCCKEAWRFQYKIQKSDGKPIADYLTEIPDDWEYCSQFDIAENKCKEHGDDKYPLCKYWPILETDLDQIDCPGFKFIKEEE